jgi:ribosomal 30S subunit maturation factor RimM
VIKGEREYLVPMVEGFINSIDVERGMIEVNTEGLSE